MNALLIFQSYLPEKLEIGMMFMTILKNGEASIHHLKDIPIDEDKYMRDNGSPVYPLIVTDEYHIIAQPHQIGWWDDGKSSDELTDLAEKHYNLILNKYEGDIDIEADENGIPTLYLGKVTISHPDYGEFEFQDDFDNCLPDCTHCNGSGIDIFDGANCSYCGGSGVEPLNEASNNPEVDWDDINGFNDQIV